MTDVRALLKAKRQEARITHPLASYNQAGQLRCVTCGTLVKHTSAWEGHLGSKAHRTNVAKLKEEKAREEQRLKEQEQVERGKRKAEEESSDSSDETDDGEIQTKRRKTDTGKPRAKSTEFPTDFFSDPYRAPLPPQSDEEEEEEPADDASKPPPLVTPPSAVDLEYERFQRELLNGPDFQETYERATVIAEPDLVPESTEGLPVQEGDGGQESRLAQKQSEETTRKLKEQDERELIMDRLLEEERAQEEADMKVTVMKTRLEALKKRRQARALKTQIVS